MKIQLFSTKDKGGGAFIAAYRLHQGLLSKGINSTLNVAIKTTDDYTVSTDKKKIRRLRHYIFPLIEDLLLRLYPNRDKVKFSPSVLSSVFFKSTAFYENQIIHLHWINNAFFNIHSLKKIKSPIVITIHDMWLFTGGCHHSGSCKKYVSGCYQCPVLKSKKKIDLAKIIFRRKIRHWKNLNLTIVSPSQWLADCARQSLILKNARIEIIPNNINTTIYKPIDKIIACTILNIPNNKPIILFGAMESLINERKGIKYFIESIQKTSKENRNNLTIVIFGANKPEKPLIENIDIIYLGEIKDDTNLALIYSSADVFVAPSLEENLPLTVMESLSCGTPVVAFNVGGVPELIDHKINGYLAKPFDSDDLTKGIDWIIEDESRIKTLQKNARDKVLTNYTTEIVVKKYRKLYNSMLIS